MEGKIEKLLKEIESGIFNDLFSKDVKLTYNYDFTDILRIEKYIKRRVPLGEEMPQHLAIALGVYLGLILKHKFKGEWVIDSENIAELSVATKIQNGEPGPIVYPIKRILNFNEDRNKHRIDGWYLLVKKICTEEINIKTTEIGIWYENDSIGQYRFLIDAENTPS